MRGRQYTGIKVRQTPTALILRTDQDKEIAIPLKEIEEQTPSKVSLMPDGLTDTLTRGELVDLVRFLSELGKGERYSVGKARLLRRWQVLQPTGEVYRLLGRKGMQSLAGDEPGLSWESAYSTVAGSLPLAGLPRFRTSKEGPAYTVLRGQLDATTSAKVRVKLGAVKGVSVYLDGDIVPAKETLDLTLTKGLHTLTIAVHHGEGADELRMEVEDCAGRGGRALRGREVSSGQ